MVGEFKGIKQNLSNPSKGVKHEVVNPLLKVKKEKGNEPYLRFRKKNRINLFQ